MNARPEVTGRKSPSTADAGQEEQQNFAPPDCGEKASPGKIIQPSYRSASPVGMARGPPIEPDAYSIAEFCERHRISVQLYYKLRQKRLTPREFRVGTRVLISKESAAAWRKQLEAENA